ncbi:hypothetical protein BIFCAT_01042 [Bifidobacterium catenulatum DSM 16992 = JCM 1194 = LMG 11043]|uniref:Uncharacterized protein n=1 Tax=Bifidobacterium catenulatum DSM 16992 = JCM 1194 = LMG 11043 TaxID=566552 RepID=B6XTZ2_9BIFI|nr:hypothetical protein BIFCAT_01042 [Bifidobacterium catenulatum DSM 16992 = JCM 1194 = LMG 11043]
MSRRAWLLLGLNARTYSQMVLTIILNKGDVGRHSKRLVEEIPRRCQKPS